MYLNTREMSIRWDTVAVTILIVPPMNTKNKTVQWYPDVRQVRKRIQWLLRIKSLIGVDKRSSLIRSVDITAVNVYDLAAAAAFMHRDEEDIYTDPCSQNIAKRLEKAGKLTISWVAPRPRHTPKALPDNSGGRVLDLIEIAKTHIRAKGEHPLRAMKQ